MTKISGIYKITSPTNRIIIGKSENIHARWNSYKKLKNCSNQTRFYRSLKKYGPENHVFEIIEICPIEKLNEREIYYIEKFNTYYTPHGLNLTKGGDGITGYKHTASAKEKISKASKKRIITDEARKNMRAAQKGRALPTEETKNKCRQSHIGKKQSIKEKNQ